MKDYQRRVKQRYTKKLAKIRYLKKNKKIEMPDKHVRKAKKPHKDNYTNTIHEDESSNEIESYKAQYSCT